MDNTLYIFIDESGNFDFSTKGSKYYILSAISTLIPEKDREKFVSLKYDLLKTGQNEEYFHATEDKQVIRDKVYELIDDTKDFQVDAIIAQKNKAHPSLYKNFDIKTNKNITADDEFYRILSEYLLKYIFVRHKKGEVTNIVIVLSSIFTNNKREKLLKSLKKYLKNNSNLTFNIYFHCSQADINSQISDYCCWALSVKYERGEIRPFQIIKNKIKSEFDVFKLGNTFYY